MGWSSSHRGIPPPPSRSGFAKAGAGKTMHPALERAQLLSRRHFFGRSATGIGTAALASLLGRDASAAEPKRHGGLTGVPHFAPKAKRIIYLFQNGAPTHVDLFDYKPE